MGSCAEHTPAHLAPDESRPHITWEIRTGGDMGDADFVCGSAKPGSPCVLQASSDERQSFATVHLFLHAAKQETSYLGEMRVPVLQDEQHRHLSEISVTVPAGTSPVGHTVNGLVTKQPGSYSMSINLEAMQAGQLAGRITEQIPITVR